MDDSQTTQPLPSHLHDLYLRYKIRTNKVISWLVSTARIRPKVVKDACENSRITVADLVDGARRLQDQDVTAPEELFWAIKDSISLRKELAQYYEMRMIGQESIRTHQHFTDCLEQISCALFPSPPFLSNRPQTNVLDQTEKPELRNLFSLLNLDETSDDYDRSESQSAAASNDIQCSQQQEQSTREQEEKWDESGQHAGSKRNEHEILELDGLGKFYEVLVWQIQLEKLINQVLSFWHLAKKGDITVTEAGWLTNVVDNAITVSAFAMDINLDEYFDTWAILGELDGISNSPVVTDLKPILTAMDDFKSTHYPRRATTKLSLLKKKWAFQVPSKLIPQDSSKEAYSDATSSATDLMLAGLLHVKEEPVFYNAYCVHTFHVSFEPGFRALYRYLVNPCGNLACLQRDKSVLAANLLLQLKVYQLWLKPECQNGPSSPPAENCRVKFLRFVLEFHDSLRAAVRHKMMHEAAKTSGECFDGTINKCLETLEKLKKLQEAKQWDLYQQAPMTAGMHMSWLREFANEKAHGLINEKGLVGALLHCYNALVTFNKIEKIPLLEHLCNIFVNHVFLGSRSNLNVCSVFRRFLGGTTGEGIGKKAKDKKREVRDFVQNSLIFALLGGILHACSIHLHSSIWFCLRFASCYISTGKSTC